MEDFKKLTVWSKAHALTLSVYQQTRAFPKDELYGLTSQIRRSAASIGANIAEGCGRRSDPEMRRFVQIARGSASELEPAPCARPRLADAERVQDFGSRDFGSSTNVDGVSSVLGAPGFR